MNTEIIQLFTKYLNNQCTKRELEKVFKLIEEGAYKDEWDFVITEDAIALVNSEQKSLLSSNEIESLQHRIQTTISTKDDETHILPVPLYYWRRVVAAAILLITLSTGTFFFLSKQNNSSNLMADIAPGGNKAVLTLANGQKIVLTDAKNGELAAQAGVVVTKLADGQVEYTVKSTQSAIATMNSIETPKGGQYQIVLPDGSKVLLNSASALIFPASFAKLKERRVQLKGEAYFEIAKEAIPFIVATDKQEVKVLGTHFNINSYEDESVTRTTLVEGSVQVNTTRAMKVLTPGYQSVVGLDGVSVAEANLEEVLAWKNGYFMFDSESITSVMRKISRWYDVEVDFQGEIPNDTFGGTVSRFSNVSKVLKKLELTNKVHFKIDGRRIIVTK